MHITIIHFVLIKENVHIVYLITSLSKDQLVLSNEDWRLGKGTKPSTVADTLLRSMGELCRLVSLADKKLEVDICFSATICATACGRASSCN